MKFPLPSEARPYGFTRAFSVLAKPIGSVCNLDCSYCYYLHKEQLLAGNHKPRMEIDLLEEYVRQYIESQDVDTVIFSWHGGEPTLAGLDFFEKIIEFQQRYANGKVIRNTIQTNGTLLDDKWCEFLKKHDFRVGLSIDGPRALHDEYRLTKSNKPTFNDVIRGLDLLKTFRVPFNTLTVVNRLNALYPEEVYSFLVNDVGSLRIQFLPCVEPKDFCSTAPHHWDPSKIPAFGSSAAK